MCSVCRTQTFLLMTVFDFYVFMAHEPNRKAWRKAITDKLSRLCQPYRSNCIDERPPSPLQFRLVDGRWRSEDVPARHLGCVASRASPGDENEFKKKTVSIFYVAAAGNYKTEQRRGASFA